jgi:hypothetical protein
MADLTRRGFLAGMSITTGVGIAGGLGLHQLLGSGASAGQTSAPDAHPTAAGRASMPAAAQLPPIPLDSVSLAGPMVVHVRDVSTGELSLMVGPQELVYRDPDLVSRLVKTAASASRAEG